MAKKAAANKKSSKPEPAAKKAAKKPEPVAKAAKPVAKKAAKKAEPVAQKAKPAAKKAARKPAGSAAITESDLAQVYAKAWVDDAFRSLLETDPTAALKQYAAENGLQWTKLVKVPAPKAGAEQDESCIHLVSCC